MTSNNKWYTIIGKRDNSISQGDILHDVPSIAVPDDIDKAEGAIDVDISYIDAIIMTQACDIEQEKADNIVLCGVESIVSFIEVQRAKGISDNRIKNTLSSIKAGKQHSCCLLGPLDKEYGDLPGDPILVNFNNIVVLPRRVIEANANKEKLRRRLNSPYREYISQRLGVYFTRVGLPEESDYIDDYLNCTASLRP